MEEKCVRKDYGTLAFKDSEKEAWKCYLEKLVNAENAWEKECLSNGFSCLYLQKCNKIIKKTKTRKAHGPSEITSEMHKIFGDAGCTLVIHIVNQLVQKDIMSNDWCNSIIVNYCKGKGPNKENH